MNLLSLAEQLATFLTPVSILFAIGIGVLTFRYNLRVGRRAHTIEVISSLNTSELLWNANWTAIKLLREPERRTSLDDLNETEEKDLVLLLNFYEFVCTSLDDGALDRRTIAHLRGGAIVQLLGLVAPMIEEWRGITDRRELYSHFQGFAEQQMGATK